MNEGTRTSLPLTPSSRHLRDHGEADEIGDGFDAEFVHGAAAVDLDGFLGDAESGGGLLVEHSGDDAVDDLKFAGGEGVEFCLGCGAGAA